MSEEHQISSQRPPNAVFLTKIASLINHALGLAITTCTQLLNTKLPKIKLEVSHLSPNIHLQVTDEGVGLPSRSSQLQLLLHPFLTLLSTPVLVDNTLTFRTTRLDEGVVRVYCLHHHSPSSCCSPHETTPKPPGLQFSGTQLSLAFDDTLVALENVVDVLQHTTATLCILQPPVKIHLSFPAVPSGTRPMDRDGDANTMETMQWKLARELRRSTCATRLLFGLSNEFYSSPSSPSSSPASEGTYIGVSACQTIPRGCRWGCCAGIVLQVRGSSTNQTHPTTRLYAFSSYAAINDTSSLTTHLKKVRWTEYGFKWNTPPLHQQQQQDCFGPLHIQLQCEQPESGAFLPTVVIHLFPTSTPTPTATSSLNTNANNNARLADLHQSILVRRAVDAAFQDLRTKCPGVVCNRRERSLARAVPVVAEVVTNIVMRSSNTELMEHIDPHSMVVGGEGIEEEVERMLREALEDSVVLALTPAAIPATAASVDEEVEGEVEVE